MQKNTAYFIKLQQAIEQLKFALDETKQEQNSNVT